VLLFLAVMIVPFVLLPKAGALAEEVLLHQPAHAVTHAKVLQSAVQLNAKVPLTIASYHWVMVF